MIDVLLIESDPKTRDIIKVGLAQFQAFEVDTAHDSWAVEMAREKNYDLLIANLVLADKLDGMELIRGIREFNQDAEVLVLTRGKSSKLLSKEKSTANIFALIPLPIDEQAFFKTISRVKTRIEKKQTRAP